MKIQISRLTKDSLIKISIILFVFLIFLSASLGLFEISISQNPIFKFHSRIFNQTDTFQTQILFSMEFIFLLISGLILTFIIPLLSPIKASLVTFIEIPIAIAIGYSNAESLLIPIEYILLTILILYISNILISYFMEIHTKQQMIATFGQYMPTHLVDELCREPKQLSLEGEAKILTVFFCDLQHFTSISEELNPKQLNKLLNEYFTVMTEILFKHDATIDKYIGDAIMAFWNAPMDQEDHAQLAVETGLEMIAFMLFSKFSVVW